MTRYRLTLLVLLLVALFSVLMLPVAAQSDACTDVPAPRLTVGAQGRVTPGSANNVRAEASRSGQIVGQLAGGQSFDVLAGPTCADGLNWWQVRSADLEGWTVESVGLDYWLEPYDPTASTVLTPTGDINYEYEGIRFELDPALATTVTASHTAPLVDDPDFDPPNAIAPSGIAFNFADSAGKKLPLSVRVYSVADFKAAYEFAERDLTNLSQLLADNPGWVPVPADQDIPMLSVVEPPMLLRARANELNFANGSGFRFLAQYAFDVHEIINPLDYQFSGITYDQQYYVIVEAAVSTPLLPDTMTQNGLAFEEKFIDYRAEVISMLKQARAEEFDINLDLLDNLIQSLQIKGTAFKAASTSGLTQVDYGDMGFTLDSSLANDIDYEIDLANWESMSPLPEHVCFSLQTDPLSHEWSGSQLCIIPVEGMDAIVSKINQLMTDKPTFDAAQNQPSIPIPFNGAVQLMHAQVNYIETESLRGIAFVSAYAQMDYPIMSGSTEYNFTGLTSDGKYIIYFEYPLVTTLLPDRRPTDDDLYQVNLNPQAYYKAVEDILNPGVPTDFAPNLDTLNALVLSIHTR